MADKYNPTQFKDLMGYLTRPSEDKKRMREYFETNDPVEFGKEIIKRAVPIDFSEVPVLENVSIGMGVPNRLEIGANFPVGGGELMIGGGMQGQDKSMGIGFRKEFDDGGRVPLQGGSDPETGQGFQKGNVFGVKENIEERNKKLIADKQKRVELAKKFIIEGDTPAEAKKKVIRQFNLKRDPKAGTPRWLTQAKEELTAAGIKFKPSKVGPPDTGGEKKAKIKRDTAIGEGKNFEERLKKEKTKTGLGQKYQTAHTANIFQAKALGINYPVDALALQTKNINEVVAEQLNDELKPLYKEQLRLRNLILKGVDVKGLRSQLNTVNFKISELVATGGSQGKAAANVLKPIIVDPYNLKGNILDLGFKTSTEIMAPPGTTTKSVVAGSTEDVMARADIKNKITQQLGELGCPTAKLALGGRVNFNSGGACVIKGREKLESILKKGVKVGSNEQVLANGILKAGQGLKNAFALRGLFGPAAIALTALTEGGILGYDMLSQGKTFKEAMGDSLFNLMLGDDYRFNNDFLAKGGTFDERLDKLKFNSNQKQLIDNFRTYVSEAQALGDASLNVDKAQRLLDDTGQIKGRLGKDRTGILEKNLAEATAAKQAADQSFQTRVQDIDFAKQLQSGMTEGQDLMGKAIDLAELQQLGSVNQNIFGKIAEGDIAKEKRQERILELLPTALNFAGGGIAKQAGDSSGKPPISGPTPQGLPGLLKRGI